MTKHYTEFEYEFHFENDPDSANLHLWLTDELFARIDEARKSLPSIHSREDFALAAILWALRSPEHDPAVVI
jgi:hypothetical protein